MNTWIHVFSEAKEHNPKNMALLCGGCHDRATRGILSKEKVKPQHEIQNASSKDPHLALLTLG
jgi:hypothetical protein